MHVHQFTPITLPCRGRAPSTRVSQLKTPSATRASVVCIELDALVSGLDRLDTSIAFNAARAVFGQHVLPGTPQLYASYMQQLLPVVQHPAEATMVLRLLADEGIVGEEAWADRQHEIQSVTRSVKVLCCPVVEGHRCLQICTVHQSVQLTSAHALQAAEARLAGKVLLLGGL